MKSATWSIMIVLTFISWPGPGLSEEVAARQPSQLTIEQAVGLALKQSPQIRGADFEIAAFDAQRKIARSRFGPVLQLE